MEWDTSRGKKNKTKQNLIGWSTRRELYVYNVEQINCFKELLLLDTLDSSGLGFWHKFSENWIILIT